MGVVWNLRVVPARSRTPPEERTSEHARKDDSHEHEHAGQAERAEKDVRQSRELALRLGDRDDDRRAGLCLNGVRSYFHAPVVNASSASARTATPVAPLG